jgi:hypothetical protein
MLTLNLEMGKHSNCSEYLLNWNKHIFFLKTYLKTKRMRKKAILRIPLGHQIEVPTE